VVIELDLEEGPRAWAARVNKRLASSDGKRLRRDEDPALLIYTSGTSGEPKGALLTHRNLTASLDPLIEEWRWSSEDHLVLALPLAHLHGLGIGVHCWLASGCHLSLFERFDAVDVLCALDARDRGVFLGVPTMYERMLAAVMEGKAPVPSRVRLYACGSAPLEPDTFDRFEEVFGQRLLVRYGMSETSMITSNSYDGPSARQRGTVGSPFPGVRVRIVGPDGAVLSSGAEGEIEVRGPNVITRYWGELDENSSAFTSDGWFRTGDVGYLDARGALFLTGRSKSVIITRGHNVSPRAVERVLTEHPDVREAVVVGLPDRSAGERVFAFLVPGEDGLRETDVLEYCARHLTPYELPEGIQRIREVPRNALGKVDRARLLSMDVS
jgi:malonyl-CoA/methylmalonyl-CoA synthetase